MCRAQNSEMFWGYEWSSVVENLDAPSALLPSTRLPQRKKKNNVKALLKDLAYNTCSIKYYWNE